MGSYVHETKIEKTERKTPLNGMLADIESERMKCNRVQD
jgi:hypothetical protein